MAREECKALLNALNKVIAYYHHQVLTVGGSGDSRNLREDLQNTRQKAQELAVATRIRLTMALRDQDLGTEERAEFECLWVAFSGCLDLLEVDMQRALALGAMFPLHSPGRPLVCTGLKANCLSTHSLRHEAHSDLDVANLRDLEREILHVREMIHDMELKVNVPLWTVQTRQASSAEVLASTGASSAGSVSVEDHTEPCDLSKALAATLFGAVLLATVVLAVCVAKLS
ncbi:PREDICTED: regulator of G-protein signaling 9-binding protein [Chrysochloris asiatica]|uniref:Regulator of G-protein signaling 9-binding protein n=1 Tax=Chrysochloris asiatica TaxID=185453 RepID=A0A9B0TTH2_CHRAS|nr:PREDICTED: regulator of G-protein signaling 9-binding protein [Chrysochloris asiatica]